MKKPKFKSTVALMIVCAGITFFAGLAWINNISISRQWHSDVMKNNSMVGFENDSFGVEKKPIKTEKETYSGPISFLDKPAGKDYSTVSTFIPFFGMLCFTIGFGRIAWKKEIKRLRPEHFPFFRFYNGITVTLGLIGTIWGLIMIGYYHEPDVSDLTTCLHTALFSTMIALIWVYLIALPVRYAMQWWDRCCYDVPKVEDTSDVVDGLLAAAADLSETLQKAGDGTINFAETMERAQEQIAGIYERMNNTASSFDGTITRFGKILELHAQLIKEQETSNASQQRVLNTFLQSLEQTQQTNQNLVTELYEQKQARQAAENKLRTIITALNS